MKFRLLLLLLFVACGLLKAQQPYKNLIFSEVRMDQHHHTYAELCNMGTVAVDLSQFELGSIGAWDDPYVPNSARFVRLPARMLAPGETFVIATVRDWLQKMSVINPEKYESITKKDTWKLADMQLHMRESPFANDPLDSVSPGASTLEAWNGRDCFYLRHHYMPGDSVVVDAVNNSFTGENGRRKDGEPMDVAGFANATREAILVRKYSVKEGTTDWEKARGVDRDDSEWLPVPLMTQGGWEVNRKEYWTVGHHGDYQLNANSIKSNTISIDWSAKKMTVDWGARNMDSIMNQFDFAPGVAWKYELSPNPIDSAFTSVRTGDKLTLYATGIKLDTTKFEMVALAAKPSDNLVIPKNQQGTNGAWFTPYQVTSKNPVIDTIHQVPFATRVDTLLKYLEKPEIATWELVWVDGIARPDLKLGDKLKVTAQNGTAKEYYIKIEKILPSHNAQLGAITWPDIPEYLKGIMGWKGDTIPTFSPTKLNYVVEVPFDHMGIPALVPKTQNVDAKVEVVRAKSLTGSQEDRTMFINTTAEDDTSHLAYTVRFEKEKLQEHFQEYVAEPFFSQIVCRENWKNTFIEITNPGNVRLDLSKYVIIRYNGDPANAISESSGVDNWASRFRRYVPGYIWQNQEDWQVQPGILVPDLNVNSLVDPGGVFVVATCHAVVAGSAARPHPRLPLVDVNFHPDHNPWKLTTFNGDNNVAYGWVNESYYLYKITNDSVLNSLKPLNDINDVELIDMFGRGNGTDWGTVDGVVTGQNSGFKRLKQYYKGNPEVAASLGDGTAGSSEWLFTNITYWEANGYGWPNNETQNSDGIGSHELVAITEYISTIGSTTYIVSEGYSMTETIIGVKNGTTVSQFLANIIKADPGQTLTVISKATGNPLAEGAEVSNEDILQVVSANGNNTSKYIMSVTAGGLDTNAVLTSTKYTVVVNGDKGTVSGFEPQTKLKDVYEGVTAPATILQFNVINADGSYASFTKLNFDTAYVNVMANDKTFFEVIAQDGKTTITYQLKPNSATSDAYVLSDVFTVDQAASTIKLIPGGTNAMSLLSNLVPAPGATMKLYDKANFERAMGNVYQDDRIVVTAADGTTTRIYYLSMLSDLPTTYLAIAYSNTFMVDQWQWKIDVNVYPIQVGDLLAGLSTSFGASAVIVDENGAIKTSGNVLKTDKVQVISADEKYTNTYAINFTVSSSQMNQGNVKLYPNPTTGLVTIEGAQQGNTVRVFSSVGRSVMSMQVGAMNETLHLNNQPAGIYMVIISDGKQEIAKFKLIKK